MRRFFVSSLATHDIGARVPLGSSAAHHAANVLRLADGDEVEIFDGQGCVARGFLRLPNAVEIHTLTQPVAAPVAVHAAVALAKGERQDWLVEKLAELGARSLTPLVSRRSAVRALPPPKHARYLRLIEAAARQSRAAYAMALNPLTAVGALAPEAAIVLHPPAPLPFLSAARACLEKHRRVCVIVGPEGGFDDAEVADLVARGAAVASFCSPILRVETAALAAVSVALAAASELSFDSQ